MLRDEKSAITTCYGVMLGVETREEGEKRRGKGKTRRKEGEKELKRGKEENR